MCGLEGGQRMRLASGADIGCAHEGECQCLLWEESFARTTKAPALELAEIAWAWRRQRAHAAGQIFTEQPPRNTSRRGI